jgi:hypothetical protein
MYRRPSIAIGGKIPGTAHDAATARRSDTPLDRSNVLKVPDTQSTAVVTSGPSGHARSSRMNAARNSSGRSLRLQRERPDGAARLFVHDLERAPQRENALHRVEVGLHGRHTAPLASVEQLFVFGAHIQSAGNLSANH